MTVAELIASLQKLPAGLEVYRKDGEEGPIEISEPFVEKELTASWELADGVKHSSRHYGRNAEEFGRGHTFSARKIVLIG